MSRMRPLDPRLLRYARSTRTFLIVTVVLGGALAGLVIAQATLLSGLLSGSALSSGLLALAGVVVLRALVVWAQDVAANRSSAAVKSQLRQRLLAHAVKLGPGWIAGQKTGELTTLATRGVDSLDAYFSRYLPQLVLAVIVPLAVGVQILTADWASAITIAVTLPLIPVFMILIGLYTQGKTRRQWRVLSVLSGHFLDVVAGLPTLKVFGRAKAQAEAVRRVTDDYRRATMSTLRIAFLSSLALELLATLSVALVAVSIGLRLVDGNLDYRTALLVLILAPEAYLPLRQVGAQFHASAEGLAAAERVFEVLETTPDASGTRTPDVGTISLNEVTVHYPGRGTPALDRESLSIEPGEIVALVGPSGAGKSTILSVLLGFVRPDQGAVTVGGVDLTDIDLDEWRRRIAWVPQRPHLFAGSIADNIRLGDTKSSQAEVAEAAALAGADEFISRLPNGYGTVLGDNGSGLSAGQRQRLALARAFLRKAPILLLDEPTSNVDGATEDVILESVRRFALGRTVVFVAHRPTLLPLADRTVQIGRLEVRA